MFPCPRAARPTACPATQRTSRRAPRSPMKSDSRLSETGRPIFCRSRVGILQARYSSVLTRRTYPNSDDKASTLRTTSACSTRVSSRGQRRIETTEPAGVVLLGCLAGGKGRLDPRRRFRGRPFRRLHLERLGTGGIPGDGRLGDPTGSDRTERAIANLSRCDRSD